MNSPEDEVFSVRASGRVKEGSGWNGPMVLREMGIGMSDSNKYGGICHLKTQYKSRYKWRRRQTYRLLRLLGAEHQTLHIV